MSNVLYHCNYAAAADAFDSAAIATAAADVASAAASSIADTANDTPSTSTVGAISSPIVLLLRLIQLLHKDHVFVITRHAPTRGRQSL